MDLVTALLDKSDQLIAVLDCETATVADCNEAQCRASGKRREEMVGRPVSEVHVNFPLGTPAQWQEFLGRIAAQPGIEVDTQYRRRDGALYPVRVKLSIHEWDSRRYVLVLARELAGEPALPSHREREANWQKALYRMASHPAMAAGRLDEMAAFIAATGQSVFPASHCAIWRIEQDLAHFAADHRGLARPGLDRPIDLAAVPWLRAVLTGGRCTDLFAVCGNTSERERTRQLAAVFGAKSVLCAPVLSGGQPWGVVTIGSTTERQWQAVEIGFGAEIADQMSQAVLSAERKSVERELIASEERYRSFVEMSAEAVWRVTFSDPIPLDLPIDRQVMAVLDRGCIADCNQAFARFFYREKREEFIGMPLKQLLAPIDQARLAEFRQMAEAGYRVVNLEANHLVDGQEKWVLRNVTGIVEDGRLIQLWGASRDITARKRAERLLTESEQRYRAFVANSSEGIFRVEYPVPIAIDLPPDEIVRRTWDTGVLAECNEALARMRGFERPEDLVGRPSIDFRLRTELEWNQDLEFLRRGYRITDMERPTRRSDGTVRWFSYSVVGVVENCCLARIWGRVADVTGRKELEEELRALSARRASTLEQERTRIAREIHDELGQQLTALKFEAAAWERGSRQPGKGDLTRSIDDAIQTVRRIATDLRPAILDHFGLVAAMEWMANEVSRRSGIECDCELETGLQIDRALATTVFRIFQEALTNAARHSEAKQVQVRLKKIGARLELSVQDDGKGFHSQEPGAVLSSLGLIGMRERARDAGGGVAIADVPGSGARVLAWFPMAERSTEREVKP